MLSCVDLKGKSFLDIGSGSGLFSLVAAQLGANVSSFDYDINSVECTRFLKQKYKFDDSVWRAEQGDVLETKYLAKYSKHDIVYSWGVLHHTGKMWEAIGNAANLVEEEGLLFIAIYNDQGWKSRIWTAIKKTYNFLPWPVNTIFSILLFPLVFVVGFLKHLILLKPMVYIRPYLNYKQRRGMNPFIDWIDWVGGYPFEVATPDAITNFVENRNFSLVKKVTCTSLGCNEFIFKKI